MPIADPAQGRTRKQIILEGDVPSPVNPPSACRFHPRCPRFVEGKCDVDEPLLTQMGSSTHLAACHFPLERWPIADDELRRSARSSGRRRLNRCVLLAAVRRFVIVFARAGGTALVSLAFGVLIGRAGRSVSVGLYVVGSVLLLGSFFVGNRGPFRAASATSAESVCSPLEGCDCAKPLRCVAVDPLRRSLLFSIGFGLIVLGTLLDPAHKAF